MNFFRPKRISFLFIIFIFSGLVVGCSQAPTSKPQKTNSTGALEYPVRGPEKAQLKVEQFSDFYCPYCKQQARILKKVFETYPDKMHWTYRHLPLSGKPEVGSFPVHEASMCAAEQGKFWEFHDYEYSLDQNADSAEMVKAISLDQTKFDTCFKSARYRELVLKDALEAEKRGVQATPTFFINGEKISGLRDFNYFAELLDPEFARKAAEDRQKAEQEFLAKLDQTETGRPMAGNEKAIVTITEFSDFHCPFCVKLTATLKQVLEAYPQEVRRVWRHFPLPIHPTSPYAHLGSECAHAQGKFWEFHEKVFANPNAARSAADMTRIAESLQLDAAKFKSCYEDPATKKKIENDVLLGMYKKVGSTPTFFINDELFIGAKSLEDMKKLIDRKIAEVKKDAAV